MPMTDRSQAKESGFAQIREALVAFEGDVVSAEFGQWGGQLTDEAGKIKPAREFMEITCINVEVTEVTEELAFVPDEWNFRVNCSDFKGSFWIEKFLESADRAKILIPDGLGGKRIAFRKETLEATDKDGNRVPKFDSTNYVIDHIVGGGAKAAPKVTPKVTTTTTPEPVAEVAAGAAEVSTADPMDIARDLAVGKTEALFRSAISLHPAFISSPLLPLAKAGAITKSLVDQGQLVEVKEGNKTVYQLPE